MSDITVDRIVAREVDYRHTVEIAIIGHDGDGVRHIARVAWEAVGDNFITEPSLALPIRHSEALTALQCLADDLWVLGYRPAPARGSAGQLEATTAHLADMQRLVFHPPRQKRQK